MRLIDADAFVNVMNLFIELMIREAGGLTERTAAFSEVLEIIQEWPAVDSAVHDSIGEGHDEQDQSNH